MQTVVYFVQATTGGPIKIGATGDLNRRLDELQSYAPTRLCLLGVCEGGFAAESWLHARLASLHSHHEWFEPGEELLAFIHSQTKSVDDLSEQFRPETQWYGPLSQKMQEAVEAMRDGLFIHLATVEVSRVLHALSGKRNSLSAFIPVTDAEGNPDYKSIATVTKQEFDAYLDELLQATHVKQIRINEIVRQRNAFGKSKGWRERPLPFHCVDVSAIGVDNKPVERTLWAPTDEATDEFLIQSLYQRRGETDIEQLSVDLEFINERRRQQGKQPIQMPNRNC
jgi:hypothetical protein